MSTLQSPPARPDRAPASLPHAGRGRAWRTWLPLSGIVALGLWLRVAGLRFGLPDVYNPDEIAIMSRALEFATGDLNPHNFLYPTFYFYVLFGWIGAFFAAGWVAGIYSSVADFQRSFFADPTAVYLAGRALSVACGVATLGVTYRLGRDLVDRLTGLTAAFFLAVAPFAVRDAHYVKHDVPVTLAVAVALLAVVHVWPKGRGTTRDTAMAAVACGVALSTHYYAVFLALPLALAVWFRFRASGTGEVVRQLLVAGIAGVTVFMLLSPFILVEPGTAWRDIVANRQIVVDRAASGSLFASAGAYARMLASAAMGWPVAGLVAAGAWRLARRDARTAAILGAFPIAFVLFISNTVPATRYLNPVLPVIAVAAAAAVAWLRTGLAGWGQRRRWATAAIVAVVVAAAGAPGLVASAETGRFFRQADTRTLARQFIERHVRPGATVLVQVYSVQLTPMKTVLLEALREHRGPGARPAGRLAGLLSVDPYPAPAYRVLYLGDADTDAERLYLPYPDADAPDGLAALRAQGVEIVVVKRPNRVPLLVRPLLAALDGHGRRLAVFSPYRPGITGAVRASVIPFQHNTDARLDAALERPGPVVEVWDIGAGR